MREGGTSGLKKGMSFGRGGFPDVVGLAAGKDSVDRKAGLRSRGCSECAVSSDHCLSEA